MAWGVVVWFVLHPVFVTVVDAKITMMLTNSYDSRGGDAHRDDDDRAWILFSLFLFVQAVPRHAVRYVRLAQRGQLPVLSQLPPLRGPQTMVSATRHTAATRGR